MSKKNIDRGPVMADIAGTTLTEAEKKRLLDPAIGGVILFRRNYENPTQLQALTDEIRALRSPHLVIAVDHEGGRVQRFIQGFTRLPAMSVLGDIWDHDGKEASLEKARTVGWVLATELIACGVDLSFTPVLDLDWGNNQVIGNRSIHHDPEVVTQLAIGLQDGLKIAGMASCGKHFPGHGFVAADSHYALPEDQRSLTELLEKDIKPFAVMSTKGMAAVMPAHIVYPAVCPRVAGFSPIWLQQILRQKLGFDGVIFSDDLTMEGAACEGDIKARAKAAFEAGCDIVLVCNKPELVDELIKGFKIPENQALATRWRKMSITAAQIEHAGQVMQTDTFKEAQQMVAKLATPKDTENGVKVGEAF